MRILISLFFYFVATPSFASNIVYKSVDGSDSGKIKLEIFQNGRFSIEGYIGEAITPENPPFKFVGTYKEKREAYEFTVESVESPGLSKITDVERKTLEQLIEGSPDLKFASKGKIRMQFAPKDLRFYGIAMELQKSEDIKPTRSKTRVLKKSPR